MKKKVNNQDFLPTIIITAMASVAIIAMLFIFFFIAVKAWPALKESGISLFTSSGFDVQIQEAFYATEDAPVYKFGMLGLIVSTLTSTGLALIMATVIGVGASIAIVEFSPSWLKLALTNLVRLLAAIPSVIFGLIGIMVVVPVIEKTFVTVDMQIAYLEFFQMTGRNLLSSIIVLTFMIVPTIVAISVDALSAVPQSYREAGYSFGMRHARVIYRILIPAAKSGIIASIILGAGRGIGEAIAVSMVCGGIGLLPNSSLGFANFLAPVLPLASAIVNKSEAMGSFSVEAGLFLAAFLLLFIGTLLSLLARFVEHHIRGVRRG